MVFTKEEEADFAQLEVIINERVSRRAELERLRVERDPQEIPQAYFDLLIEGQVGAINVYYRHNNTGEYEYRRDETSGQMEHEFWRFTVSGSTQSVNNYGPLIDCDLKLMEKYPNEKFRFMPLSAPEANPGKGSELLEQGYQLHEHK